MATITVLEKIRDKKVRLEIDLDQWEKLADVFGFYRPDFKKTLQKSLKESKRGLVRKIQTLDELN